MTREENLLFWIKLLELEVEALRSVLSEFVEDKSCFTQWSKAEAIDEMKKHLVHP